MTKYAKLDTILK